MRSTEEKVELLTAAITVPSSSKGYKHFDIANRFQTRFLVFSDTKKLTGLFVNFLDETSIVSLEHP